MDRGEAGLGRETRFVIAVACNAVTDFIIEGWLTTWTAPCLKSRMHRSGLLINVFWVNAVPSPPRGEKVAVRPDEGLSQKAAC